jgi:hypothetical protein
MGNHPQQKTCSRMLAQILVVPLASLGYFLVGVHQKQRWVWSLTNQNQLPLNASYMRSFVSKKNTD